MRWSFAIPYAAGLPSYSIYYWVELSWVVRAFVFASRTAISKTTPIQQDANLDTQPTYGRRSINLIGGKPTALAANNSFGLHFFPEDNATSSDLEKGEIPRLRPGIITTGASGAVTPLSSGGTPASRLQPNISGPCCALPFPVTQAHNIGTYFVPVCIHVTSTTAMSHVCTDEEWKSVLRLRIIVPSEREVWCSLVSHIRSRESFSISTSQWPMKWGPLNLQHLNHYVNNISGTLLPRKTHRLFHL